MTFDKKLQYELSRMVANTRTTVILFCFRPLNI